MERKLVDGTWLVEVAGTLNENIRGEDLVKGLRGTVVFDLDGVLRVTSFGVREWMTALLALRAEYYCFIRCRPSVVNQFNMVNGFGRRGVVVSLYAPFVCTDCGEAVDHLLDLREHHAALAAGMVPSPESCAKCGASVEFDDIADSYFSYVCS